MQISILTLFPQMFTGPFSSSIVKKAQENGFVDIDFVDIRESGLGKHKIVDDTAYGGGVGMVMRVDVLENAIKKARKNVSKEKVVLLSAKGESYTQKKALEYSHLDSLILICGHYEGVDERVLGFVDEEISIGDFVTTGGEIPAMLITDSVTRLIPGVLKEGATEEESFSLTDNESSFLEYPHYTRPETYKDKKVPEILLSGDHKKIAAWKKEMAKKITEEKRPDLLAPKKEID